MSDHDLLKTVEASVEKEKQRYRRNTVIANVFSFIVLVPLFWYIFFNATGPAAMLVLILVTLAWLMTLLTQIGAYLYDKPRKTREIYERMMQLERLNAQIRLAEEQIAQKPKRDQHLRLSTDGELIPVDEDDNFSAHTNSQRG